ncbi:MAG TPA: OsmC family protein [Acidimicrobiia bacterium]|jgi:uncharacterized OsmC-like protein|nr:OsmC family protein [Acidimicrobiia bacterium]
MTITTRLNDVDLATVAGLVGNIRTEPEHAKTTWQASVSWQGAFRSEARVREFDPIQSDEPEALGGTDTAPNPVEQVLAALGHCLAVGYAANASAEGIGIKELSIDLEGDLDLHTFLGLADGHAGFDNIRATVRLISDADPDAIAALHRNVVSTSPVGHTLGRAVPVEVTLDH